MKFILSRTEDFAIHSKKWIVGYGLSFKRWQVAFAAASIPAYILWQHLSYLTIVSALLYLASMIAVFFLIYGLTSDSYWNKLRKTCYISTIWVSTIAFGLIHLIAFSYYSLSLVPYMLCVVSVPFFGGCAITYYRINLGFWWGVGMHIFNNLPAIILLIL